MELQPELEWNSYADALRAAGATVHDFASFGTWQGEWWAKVTLPDGRTGFVGGSFGSCSHCDAFQSEFGDAEPRCADHRYQWKATPETEACAACAIAAADYQVRLVAFGAEYLDNLQTADAALVEARRNLSWDGGAEAMVAWLEARA
jgi:hypothetical protein